MAENWAILDMFSNLFFLKKKLDLLAFINKRLQGIVSGGLKTVIRLQYNEYYSFGPN